MMGNGVTAYHFQEPTSVLIIGAINALLLGLVVTLAVKFEFDSAIYASVGGVCMYAGYLFNQYRRIFHLGKAPSRMTLGSCYMGDFWEFMELTNTNIERLQDSFWRHFYVPILLVFASFVLYWSSY
jgi:hypothetical protein